MRLGEISTADASPGNHAQPENRFRREPGEPFPGFVHPGHPERRIEPEHRLARLLPELIWLERRNAWRRHEKWFSLGTGAC